MKKKKFLSEEDQRTTIEKIIDMVIHSGTEENLIKVAFDKLIGEYEKKYNSSIPPKQSKDFLKQIINTEYESKKLLIIRELEMLFQNGKNTESSNSLKTKSGLTIYDPKNLYNLVKKNGKGICVCSQMGPVNQVVVTNDVLGFENEWYRPILKNECGCFVFDSNGIIFAGLFHSKKSQDYGKLGKATGEHLCIIPASMAKESKTIF